MCVVWISAFRSCPQANPGVVAINTQTDYADWICKPFICAVTIKQRYCGLKWIAFSVQSLRSSEFKFGVNVSQRQHVVRKAFHITLLDASRFPQNPYRICLPSQQAFRAMMKSCARPTVAFETPSPFLYAIRQCKPTCFRCSLVRNSCSYHVFWSTQGDRGCHQALHKDVSRNLRHKPTSCGTDIAILPHRFTRFLIEKLPQAIVATPALLAILFTLAFL